MVLHIDVYILCRYDKLLSILKGEFDMKLKSSLFAFVCVSFFTVSTMATESDPSSRTTLNANLRRLGFEYSTTHVDHAKEYSNSPVSQLSGDSQSVIKGVLDFALEYNRDNIRWNNGLFLEYGKTKLEPADGPEESNETSDKILLSTNYAYKAWKYDTYNIGPMVVGEYQTEFTENDNAPRMKVFRGKGGLALFEGDIIKDLYIVGVTEYDMTYSNEKVSKIAGEIGWRIQYDLRDGVQFSTDGYYRDYFSYSKYVGTDLEYDFNATARMDVQLIDNLTFGPYLSYRRAQSREANVAGSNLQVGVALTYKNLYSIK